MSLEQLELNPRIIAAVENAHIGSAGEVLRCSGPDLQRRTSLSAADVRRLQTAVAASLCPNPPVSALQVSRGECPEWDCGLRLSVGCPVLDAVLRGGLLPWGLTELAGASGAGKSQLAMQICLSVQYPARYGGLGAGALYICTEDQFPIRRLKQLQAEQPSLRTDVPPDVISSIPFSDNIYVEHAADLAALMACVSQRAPVLLGQGRVRLVVVDSVAALFRSEFQAGLERARHLTAFSSALHQLSSTYRLPVLCVNQVTDVMEGDANHAGLSPVDSKVLPALGMAWANQVTVRLMVTRLPGAGPVSMGTQSSAPRRLQVVFAPHLATDSCVFGVWREGVRGLQEASSRPHPIAVDKSPCT